MSTPTLKLSDCAIDLDEARGVIDRLEQRLADAQAELQRYKDRLHGAYAELAALNQTTNTDEK